jgi:hypothetical protein
MTAAKYPAPDKGMTAAHEAGSHDRKTRPDACQWCAMIKAGVPTCYVCGMPVPDGKAIKRHANEHRIDEGTVTTHAPYPDDKLVEPPTPLVPADKLPIPELPRRNAIVAPGPGSTIEYIGPALSTRESWMQAGVDAMRPWFPEGTTVPEVHVSIGWPGGRGNKQAVVGQCWMGSTVEDGHPAIFVSPVHRDAWEVLETLLHEMVHASGARGHRGEFVKVARAVGFVAPWKSTPSSPELKARLEKLAGELGEFPHSRVNSAGGLLGIGPERPPVQSTRMIKVECPECGYTLRTTRKWLDIAVPQCPVEGEQMEVQA